MYQRPAIAQTRLPDLWGFTTLRSHVKKRCQSRGLAITLHNDYAAKVYNTGSSISGELVVSPRKNLRFDSIRICFVGNALVRHQEVQTSSLVAHHFLDVDMPIPATAYPATRVFEAGQTYTIPFVFVVPAQLPTEACSHATNSPCLAGHHRRLPPSMKSWQKDDMAPEMTEVQYEVRASIVKPRTARCCLSRTLKASKRVMVLPEAPEDPPLSLGADSRWYKLSRTKTLRKSLFSASLGQLSAVATQAATVYLGPDGRATSPSTVPLTLSYDPASPSSSPPEIKSLTGKLHAETWWNGQPFRHFPHLGSTNEPFTAFVPMEVRLDDKAPWTRHGEPSIRSEEKPSGFWTTTMDVSLHLPASRKTILPTFHSCLISRTYSVQIVVRAGRDRVKLVVPVQVCMQGSDEKTREDMTELPSFEEALGYH